jgi:hypothetical protein
LRALGVGPHVGVVVRPLQAVGVRRVCEAEALEIVEERLAVMPDES